MDFISICLGNGLWAEKLTWNQRSLAEQEFYGEMCCHQLVFC